MGQGAKNGTQGAAAADEDLAFFCSPMRPTKGGVIAMGGVCHDRNPGHAGLARGRHADGGRCAMIAETCRSTADPHAARGYPPGVIDPVHTCAWALAINLTKVRVGNSTTPTSQPYAVLPACVRRLSARTTRA